MSSTNGLFDELGGSTSVARLIIVAFASVGLILFVAFVMSRLLRARTRGISIRMQIFIALGAIVGAFAFGLGLMVIDRIEARAVRVATEGAEDEAKVISGMIASEMARTGADLPVVARRFDDVHLGGAHLTVEVLDARGAALFPRGVDASGSPGAVTVQAPVVVNGVRFGAVRVVKPTVVVARLLADFAPTVLVISLVLGAAAALAAAWIGRAIAAPIEAISLFGERVSEGERTDSPFPFSAGREVTRLWLSIDSMRRQLEGRPFVETFAADLSHELKNPVAAIRASAEVLEEGAIDDPLAARRFVGRIREATDRIERLLRELLGLASIEARGVEAFSPVDVGKMTQSIVESLDEAKRIELRVEGDLRVRGDEVWLGRALRNVVDNALAHSEPGSPVRVDVRRDADDVVVSVVNRGSVAAHVQKRAFRRFVTTRSDKGGTGLGLAIARAVAEAHRGRAELAEPGPPEVEFRLRLPAFRRSPPAFGSEGVASLRNIGEK